MTATAQRVSRVYTEDDIQRYLREGEGSTVELKTGVPEPRQLARHIGSFANSDGGVILLGVDERGEITGCDTARAKRAYHAALDRLRPVPETEFHEISAGAGTVVLIEVAKSDGPVLFDGGAYVRVGAQTQVMSAADIIAHFNPAKPATDILERLAEAVTYQTKLLETLQQEMRQSGRFMNRMKEWLISGVIGAILGLGLTKILGG